MDMSRFESPEFDEQLRELSAEFRERFDLLEETGQVTPLARWLTEHALAEIAQNLGVKLDDEKASQFVTHVGIALTRLQRGDGHVSASEVVTQAIADRTHERQVVRWVMDQCEQLLDRKVSDVEVDFMTVHLCALLEDDD
jgi:transcriptional regulatory protein LevR